MKIAIIGAGNVGRAIGEAWRHAGHDVVYGVPDPGSPKYAPLARDRLKRTEEAAPAAEIIVLATPWEAAEGICRSLGGLLGKIIIDCMNPVRMGPDGLALTVGASQSGGELVQSWCPGASVFKTLNQAGFEIMGDASKLAGRPVMFIAGDDSAAKPRVLDLVRGLGFEAIDAGPLKIARFLEPYAALWINLAFKQGLGRNFAFGLLRPQNLNRRGALMSVKNINPVNPKRPKRIAIVLSNPATSPTTGWPVGFWWSELTHPYYAFTGKGYKVEIFSPKGGKCVSDAMSDPRDPSGYSADDLISMGFIATPKLAALVETTKPVSEIAVADFDAIVVAGGQSPMATFEYEHGLHRRFVEFYEAGKIACALCHGVALLRYARLSSGEYLVKGKTVTGFANVEEDYADNAVWTMGLLSRDKHVTPWRIEDELKKLGANYVQAGLWRGFAIRDGNLITGQQNFSGAETAEKVIEAIGE